MKKISETEKAAIRESCQIAEDLDKRVTSVSRLYGISEAEVLAIVKERPQAEAPAAVPAAKKLGRPKGAKTSVAKAAVMNEDGLPPTSTPKKASAPAAKRAPRSSGQLGKLRAAMAGLTASLEDVDRYLPLTEGEKAIIRMYFNRLQSFESGVAFAENCHTKEVADGAH